jgi:hypothetical protein
LQEKRRRPDDLGRAAPSAYRQRPSADRKQRRGRQYIIGWDAPAGYHGDRAEQHQEQRHPSTGSGGSKSIKKIRGKQKMGKIEKNMEIVAIKKK